MGIMADQTLHKITELESTVVETVWKNRRSDLWDNLKQPNTLVFGVSEPG